MKKMILIGEAGSGKSTLIRVLSGRSFTAPKTQAVEFCGSFVDTPGEYLQNRRFFSALMTTSADCDIVGLVQDATRNSNSFPPHFAASFNGKQVIGIVTKIDAADKDAARAKLWLEKAGAGQIIESSSKTRTGLERLKHLLTTEAGQHEL